jgi:hypothetical protein
MANKYNYYMVLFPGRNRLLCKECLDAETLRCNNSVSPFNNNRGYYCEMRNDCQSRKHHVGEGMPYCLCCCEFRFSEKCMCHKPVGNENSRRCMCCQICRYMTVTRLCLIVSPFGDNGVAKYDSCALCKRYVVHQFRDKDNVKYSYGSFESLHQFVENKLSLGL